MDSVVLDWELAAGAASLGAGAAGAAFASLEDPDAGGGGLLLLESPTTLPAAPAAPAAVEDESGGFALTTSTSVVFEVDLRVVLEEDGFTTLRERDEVVVCC